MSIWNSFGWCGPHFRSLHEADPAFVNRLAELDLGSLHLFALAVDYWDKQGRKDPTGFAWELRTCRQPVLLKRYVRHAPSGLLSSLTKLGRRITARRHYATLVYLLRQRNAAKLVRHRAHLTPVFLDGLARIPDRFCAGSAVAALASDQSAIDHLLYALEVIGRARPELDETAIQESLARQRVGFEVITWLEGWLKDCPFPEPPFSGDDLLKPIENVHTLETTAKSFRNCLADKTTQIIAGQRYYYLWRGSRNAVIELLREPLLGWRLGEIRRPRNRSVDRVAELKIRTHLNARGILATMSALEHDPLGLTY